MAIRMPVSIRPLLAVLPLLAAAVVLLLLLLGVGPLADAKDTSKPSWSYEQLKGRDFASPTQRHSANLYDRYRHLWYHGSLFYGITEAGGAGLNTTKLTVATKLYSYPVVDVTDFASNIGAITLGGAAVVLEHPYNAYTHDLGFWLELLLSLIHTVLDPDLPAALHSNHISKVIIANAYDNEVPQWVLDVLQITLGLPGVPVDGETGPELLFRGDLEIINMTFWAHLDEVLVPHMRYTMENKDFMPGFLSPAVAGMFRSKAYEWLEDRSEGQSREAPRFISLVTYNDTAPVHNWPEILAALEEVAAEAGLEARHLALSSATPTAEVISALKNTRVMVARHSPVLANLIFLPVGAAVVELLPYNWIAQDLDTLFRNITLSIGDLSYSAWRAEDPKFCVYDSIADARFAHFGPEDCNTMTCIEVHSRAGMAADVQAIAGEVRGVVLEI